MRCADTRCTTALTVPLIHPPPPPPRPETRDQAAANKRLKLKSKMAAEVEYESVLCVKPDVNVYRIPPRASNRAVR